MTKKPKDETHELRLLETKRDDLPRQMADLLVEGPVSNALLMLQFSKATTSGTKPDLTELVHSLRASGKKAQAGDLAAGEAMLMQQATVLNAIFGELASRAALNVGEYMNATETYMRLALKAQAQCRSTLEALAAIKNPPVVYARQANIAHGPQQVNNGRASSESAQYAPAPAPAANPAAAQNGLLEAQHGERMDTGATRTSGGADPNLAPVGAVHRAAHR